jgi:CRP/FNR family transcriptional regulator
MAVVHLDTDRKSNGAVPSAAMTELGCQRQAPGGDEGGILAIARKHATDRRSLAGGMELFAEGEVSDCLYVVLDGWLILHRILEDGRRQILDFALPGAVIGYRTGSDAAFEFSAEAVTPSSVAVIPLARIASLLREGSAASLTLLSALNEALLGAFDSLTDIGRRTAREAVAHFLLRMSRRIRRAGHAGRGDALPFPLTQEHIGDALGLTAVHVCRTLRTLRADGLVTLGCGRLRIEDADALAEEAAVYCFEHDIPRLAS